MDEQRLPRRAQVETTGSPQNRQGPRALLQGQGAEAYVLGLDLDCLSPSLAHFSTVEREAVLAEQLQRRLSRRIAQEVKKRWTEIDKLVTHKLLAEEAAEKKAAQEAQLHTLVSQTEKCVSDCIKNNDAPLADIDGDPMPSCYSFLHRPQVL